MTIVLGLLSAGCEDTDIGMATQAGIEDHIKKKIRLAYANSAVRKAIASQRNGAGQVARGVLGALAQQPVNAKFSQQEEREADGFGLAFIQGQGLGEQPAVSAMMKLSVPGSEHSFLSSHPAPRARAERLKENPRVPAKAEKTSLLERVIAWLKSIWPFGRDAQAGQAKNDLDRFFTDSPPWRVAGSKARGHRSA